jgi:hypothetical protein
MLHAPMWLSKCMIHVRASQFFIETLKKDVVVVEEHKLDRLSQVGLVEVSPPNHGRLEWYDANLRPLLRDDYVVVLSSMVRPAHST